MTISLSSDLEKFVREKIRGGEFATADEVVEAGLRRLMDEAVNGDDELDDETLAAIEEGSAQLDRGEGIPLDEVFARLGRKNSANDGTR